jgi:uncharacterized membrane protein YeaQ/YmgE (transglycosylase-associated protein family)
MAVLLLTPAERAVAGLPICRSDCCGATEMLRATLLFPSFMARLPGEWASEAADFAWQRRYRGRVAMQNRAGRGRGGSREGRHMPFTGEGIIVTLIIGLIAGWGASKIVSGTGLGLIGDIVVGIVGAFIAAWLFPYLGIALGSGIIREIIDALIGAIILLVVIKLIRGAM